MSRIWLPCFTVSLFSLFGHAADEYQIELKDHLFSPSKIEIPAGKKVRLHIINHDQTAEEFDSFDLNREKVIFAGRRATIFIGPLEPGEYHFFGEYHPSQARGKVVVTQAVTGDKDAD